MSKSDIIDQLEFEIFNKWKKKMNKESNCNIRDKKSLEKMTEKEMFLRVMDLFSNIKIPESKRRKMLEEVEKIALEPDEPGRE